MFFFDDLALLMWKQGVEYTLGWNRWCFKYASSWTANWIKFWDSGMQTGPQKEPEYYWKQIHDIWIKDSPLNIKTAQTQEIVNGLFKMPISETLKEKYMEFFSMVVMDAAYQNVWKSCDETCGIAYGVVTRGAKSQIMKFMDNIGLSKSWEKAWKSCEKTCGRSYGVE